MIEKTGTVEITDEEIIVSNFTFKGIILQSAQQEALKWARDKIDEHIR